jgi:beta-xylosidase
MRALILSLLCACVVGDEYEPELDDESVVAPPADLVDDSVDPNELDGDVDTDDTDPYGSDPLAASAMFRNPLGPSCADPGVIRADDASGRTFWAACTGGGFPLWKSKDLVTWTAAGKLFSAATKPAWADGNNWAPEVHRVGEQYVAYFTARSASRGKMCIGAATASAMTGPWKDLGHPLVCDSHVSLIDSSYYRDGATGRHYLLYKTDGNGLSPQEQTVIYAQELGPLGLKPIGTRRALIRNTLAWEGDVVEAPVMIHRGSYYYLFYSGFRYCNGTYGVGVARAKSPLGPFAKRSAPVLRTNAGFAGPGHNSIVRTGGRAYAVYHAYVGAHECGQDGSRKLMVDAITWSGGWPTIGNGTPTRTSQPAPVVP